MSITGSIFPIIPSTNWFSWRKEGRPCARRPLDSMARRRKTDHHKLLRTHFCMRLHPDLSTDFSGLEKQNHDGVPAFSSNPGRHALDQSLTHEYVSRMVRRNKTLGIPRRRRARSRYSRRREYIHDRFLENATLYEPFQGSAQNPASWHTSIKHGGVENAKVRRSRLRHRSSEMDLLVRSDDDSGPGDPEHVEKAVDRESSQDDTSGSSSRPHLPTTITKRNVREAFLSAAQRDCAPPASVANQRKRSYSTFKEQRFRSNRWNYPKSTKRRIANMVSFRLRASRPDSTTASEIAALDKPIKQKPFTNVTQLSIDGREQALRMLSSLESETSMRSKRVLRPYVADRPAPDLDVEPQICAAVALDCEMVESRNADGQTIGNELIWLGVVDYLTGETLIDTMVKPDHEVVDWRTFITGLRAADLDDAVQAGNVLLGTAGARAALFKYVNSDTILVGHHISMDLGSMKLSHDRVIDTRTIANKAQGMKQGICGLKRLCKDLLNIDIQTGIHSALEDALATRELALWFSLNPTALAEWGAKQRENSILEKQAKKKAQPQQQRTLTEEQRQMKEARRAVRLAAWKATQAAKKPTQQASP